MRRGSLASRHELRSALAACTLRGLAAANDCYGGGVVAKPEELTARQLVAPIDFTKDRQGPQLGSRSSARTCSSPERARVIRA